MPSIVPEEVSGGGERLVKIAFKVRPPVEEIGHVDGKADVVMGGYEPTLAEIESQIVAVSS